MYNRMKKLLQPLIFLAIASPLFAQTARVIVKPAVVMRDKPNISGKLVGKIPFGKDAAVVEEAPEQVTLMGVTGKWTHVDFEGKRGWVFGAFLARGNSE